MHPFPLIEALWASLDSEKPSGDDPKRVVFALAKFYVDFERAAREQAESRWRTPLFKKRWPEIKEALRTLRSASDKLSQGDNKREDYEVLKQPDLTLRKATFELEQEDKQLLLEALPSPKINRFNYLYEGWKRGYLSSSKVESYTKEYRKLVKETRAEIESVLPKVNPKESQRETEAIESAVAVLGELDQDLKNFLGKIPAGHSACQDSVSRILPQAHKMSEAFQTLESCAPLEDPCPFCGGEISLSGRCRSCARRLPHLETQGSEPGDGEQSSDFQSNNCRALDLAYTAWVKEPQNQESWKALQKAVRDFSEHVQRGRQSLSELEMLPDRPISSSNELRQKEVQLQEISDGFQKALTVLSRFTQNSQPPSQPLSEDWRVDLLAVEQRLQEIENSVKPAEDAASS